MAKILLSRNPSCDQRSPLASLVNIIVSTARSPILPDKSMPALSNDWDILQLN